MKSSFLPIAIVAMTAMAALPVDATDGGQTFRVLTTGDAYIIALPSTCLFTYDDPPTVPPNQHDTLCWLFKTNLGYDGLTGARTWATQQHLNHSFTCEVVNSATGVVGQALPYPANMAISDSIVVVFDSNNDGQSDSSYGGRMDHPSVGDVQARVVAAVQNGDVATLSKTPEWFLNGLSLNGATPVVSGTVDGGELAIWNQGGSDVTAECTF